MNTIPFVKQVLPPETAVETPGVFLGIGFVGSDGRVGQFGFQMLPFLWVAERVRKKLGVAQGTVILMDQVHDRQFEVKESIWILQRLLQLLGVSDGWQLLPFSQMYENPTAIWGQHQTYEAVQAQIIHDVLPRGGYQVGWLHPSQTAATKDELYFARKFQELHPHRRDIGFVLGEFPTLMPAGVPGAPYLVKADHEKSRLLLTETPHAARQKFSPGGQLAKVKGGKLWPILRIFQEAGILPPVVNGTPPVELLIEAMGKLRRRLLDIEEEE
jgi:hypothetical protein